MADLKINISVIILNKLDLILYLKDKDHFDVWQKTIRFCKAILLPLKINTLKKRQSDIELKKCNYIVFINTSVT